MQFPINIFNPFNHAKLTWRTSQFFQYTLSNKKFSKLSHTLVSDFTYLTLTCRRDLLMTKLNLWSLARFVSHLPQLVVAHDESLTAAEVRTELAFWPYQINCLDRTAVINHFSSNSSAELAEFSSRHIFGFKLGACLLLANESRVLYSDADVLWFGNAHDLMAQYQSGFVWGGVDCNRSYNPTLLEWLSDEHAALLNQLPFVNAGFAVYNRPLPELPWFRATLKEILQADPIHEFSEQTLVALLAKTEGGTFADESVYVGCDYRTAVNPSNVNKRWLARHYIRPAREQFWIDAISVL